MNFHKGTSLELWVNHSLELKAKDGCTSVHLKVHISVTINRYRDTSGG
ncbi:hypothetical protein MJH12_05275 [bacterium]|nr:hypothetical protein [bacterium]